MNTRFHKNHSSLIHQLAHQAHDETNVLYHERLKTEHPAEVIFYDMFNQRFAELIIRECAKAADQGLAEVTMKGPEWPSYYIKKHLGIDK